MTAKNRFFRDGALLTAVALAVRTVNLFFGAFVGRTVLAEGLGLYTLLMTVFGFAVTFATSGVSLTVTRLCADAVGEGDFPRVRAVLRASVRYALAFSLTATLFLLLLARPLALRAVGDMRAAPALSVLTLSLCPIALSAVFSGYFIGVHRVARNAAAQVLTQGVRMGVTCLFLRQVAAGGAIPACFFLSAVSAGSDVLCFLLLLGQFLAEQRSLPPAGDSAMPRVIGMAVPLAFSAYIRQALLTVEHILIPERLCKGGSTRAEALASYGVLHGMAMPVLLYPMAPLTSFSGLLVPEFAECLAAGKHDRMRRMAEQAVHATLVYAVAVAVILWLFSEEIGFRVYHSYQAGYFIAVLAVVVPMMYLDHVTDAMLKGIGEHVYSMWVNISDAALSVVLVYFLLPRLGILGYAVAIILMESYNFLLSFLRLRRRVRFALRPGRSLLLPALCAALAAFATRRLFIMHGDVTSHLWLLLKILFAACLFLALYLPSVLLWDRLFARTARKKSGIVT